MLLATLILGVASASLAGPVPPGMTRIPGGIFHPMFTAENDPKDVPVKAFCLDISPVTNREFLEFVRANLRWQRSRVKRIFADESYLRNWAADTDPGTNVLLNAPVTHVSWFVAKAYADWVGKRLPSVAEWEHAAGAGFTRADGERDEEYKRRVFQWYATLSPSQLPAVGGDPANFWGVHNLHGLIWEWTTDFNTVMVTGDARNDSGLDRQLYCGSGSQGARDLKDYPAFMRYGFRSSLKADYCVHNLGFRCATDL